MEYKTRHILTLSILILIGSIVAYIVVPFSPKKSVIIELTNEKLTVDEKLITRLIVNPKDRLPDFPASAYRDFAIAPLKAEIQKYALDSINSLQIRVPDSFVYAVWKPLMLTAQECEFKSIVIGCASGWSVNRIFNNSILGAEIRFSNRNCDTIPARAAIIISPDSIIVKRKNLGVYISSPPNPMMRDSAFFKQDSILDAFFMKQEITERLFAMKSKYSKRELENLINRISDSTEVGGRIDLQIRPTTSCRQIVNFLHDFNQIVETEHGIKDSKKYIDNAMEFSI